MNGATELGDSINHPTHYEQSHPGMECINLADGLSFSLGNMVKYVWRYRSKGKLVEDLEKAAWYLDHASERGEQVALTLVQRRMLERLGDTSDGYESGFWRALLDGDLAACRSALDGLIELTGEEASRV